MPGKNSNSSHITWRFLPFYFALIVAGGIAGAFIDFPAGDSWTYGWTVEQWLKGNYIFNDWSSALALPQVVLGYIAHLGSGAVSWRLLSVLTAIATIIGAVVAAYLTSILHRGNNKITALTPLFALLLLSPIFTVKIAAGFMTDGYYFLFLAISLWLLISITVEPARNSPASWLLMWFAFTLMALVAATQRSHGIFLLLITPAWIFLTKILMPGKMEKSRWDPKSAWSAVVITIAGLAAYFMITSIPGFGPARSAEVIGEVKSFWTGGMMPFTSVLKNRFILAFGIIHHLGFTLFPILLPARFYLGSMEWSGKSPKKVNLWYVFFGTLFLLFTVIQWSRGEIFPYVPNSLTPEGFGPRSDTLALTSGYELAWGLRLSLTFISTVGGISLIWLLSRLVKIRGIDWGAPLTLFGLIGLAHFGVIFLNPHFFDRYLLPVLPFLLIWFAPSLENISGKWRLSAWLMTIALLAFSIFGTVDALDWTKSKWDIAGRASERGIEMNRIVAGYEVDGYYNYTNETYPDSQPSGRQVPLPSPWWVGRLGLDIIPVYVVAERDAPVLDTDYMEYIPTDIKNERMIVLINRNVRQDPN